MGMCLAQPGYGSGLLYLLFTTAQINGLLHSTSVVHFHLNVFFNTFLLLKKNVQAILLHLPK